MTPQQVAHFHTLGFVQCRKLFSPREMRTLSDAFDAAMSRARGGAPPPGPGDKRQQVAPFFDHDPQAFYPLLDDERLVTAFETLMGDDFILLESEGLLHTEGSRWHHDARAPTGLFSMRAAIYLDPLEPGDGCLDIIPALARSGLVITSQSVGHGFGIGMHEFPVLHAHEPAEIEPGMVLNIEPAAKDADGFLYHTEDTLVVTDGEPRILTDLMDTDELFVIG